MNFGAIVAFSKDTDCSVQSCKLWLLRTVWFMVLFDLNIAEQNFKLKPHLEDF